MDTSSLSRAHDPIDPRYAHAEDLVALLDELAAACPEGAEWIAMWRARITFRSAKILELTARPMLSCTARCL